MREVTLRIEDSAFEPFVGFLQLCQKVEVVSVNNGVDTRDAVDKSFAYAIRELRSRQVFKTAGDYYYIMQAANDCVIYPTLFFFTPSEFLSYLGAIGINNLPGRSTLYDKKDTVEGTFPEWTFADSDKINQFEALRRKNIVVQFLSAFTKEKRRLLDATLDK